MNSAVLRSLCLQIQLRLVNREYDRLASESRGRLSADEMRNAVMEYGRKLRMPKEDELVCDIIPLNDGSGFSVVAPLWTDEEGMSDLSLEFTVYVRDGEHTLVLNNIHVR